MPSQINKPLQKEDSWSRETFVSINSLKLCKSEERMHFLNARPKRARIFYLFKNMPNGSEVSIIPLRNKVYDIRAVLDRFYCSAPFQIKTQESMRV